MSLPAEVRELYVRYIDEALAHADLSTISEKRIRQSIQEKVEYDITPQKAAIKELILSRFDLFNARQNAREEPVPSVEHNHKPTPTTNGHVKVKARSHSQSESHAESRSDTTRRESTPPAKKKAKVEETDAEMAARLQAEEARSARPSRNGGARKVMPKKKKIGIKKKSATKVAGSDDSDMEHGTERKVNRNTGFHKPLNLTPAASDFFGATQMSRPEVTKQVWVYIREHGLQDPEDKRYINCDDRLQSLLKQNRIHMFQMTKVLSQHLKNPEE